jgi:endonuclease V-like protein UPF0215 family
MQEKGGMGKAMNSVMDRIKSPDYKEPTLEEIDRGLSNYFAKRAKRKRAMREVPIENFYNMKECPFCYSSLTLEPATFIVDGKSFIGVDKAECENSRLVFVAREPLKLEDIKS